MNRDDQDLIYRVNDAFEWRKWMERIPYIQWPSDWLVKAVPPFSTGIIRYWVTKKGLKGQASIYLDCYDRAGFMQQPYWEVHPVDGDCQRCYLDQTEELVTIIKKSLDQMASDKQSETQI